MESMYWGRTDFQDFNMRKNQSRLEWVWQGSQSLGDTAQIFAGELYGGSPLQGGDGDPLESSAGGGGAGYFGGGGGTGPGSEDGRGEGGGRNGRIGRTDRARGARLSLRLPVANPRASAA